MTTVTEVKFLRITDLNDTRDEAFRVSIYFSDGRDYHTQIQVGSRDFVVTAQLRELVRLIERGQVGP